MDAFTLVLQAPLGQIQQVANHNHVCVGRGVAGIPNDPRVSRQHVIFAMDPRTGSISATWMARQRGRLHSRSCCTELECGKQTTILPGDVLTLLADCGKHILLVQRGTSAEPVPARPSARAWALLESDALAAAQFAARHEVRARAQLAHMLADATGSGTSAMDDLDPGYRTCQDARLATSARSSVQAARMDRVRQTAHETAWLPPPPAPPVARADEALHAPPPVGRLRFVATQTEERRSGMHARMRRRHPEMPEMEVALAAHPVPNPGPGPGQPCAVGIRQLRCSRWR